MISIITINYGTADKIKKLWNTLKNVSPKENFEFIVVDNNSVNQEGQKLKEFFANEKNAHVICLKENLGFGGGHQIGVKFANGEFLGIVNPDIETTENCFQILLGILKKDETIGIVAPKLKNPEGSFQKNARKFPTPWTLFGRKFSFSFAENDDCDPRWYQAESPVAVDWVQGSFLLLRTDFFIKTLNGFDPRFFLFLEDTDLCRRTHATGKKVVLVPQSVAYHGTKRLSGNHFWDSVFKKTFWIHIHSALKYFWKYRNN